MKKYIKYKSRYLLLLFVFVLSWLSLLGLFNQAQAAQITGRTMTLGTSLASASTTYTLTFTVPTTGTAIKSVRVKMCTTSSGSCTAPSGFTNASATLSSQPTNLGAASGWTVDDSTGGGNPCSTTNSSLCILDASNATNPSGAQTIVWGSVTNPSATNSTFYGLITTYSDSTYTTAVDTGTVASSTAGTTTVTASVFESLTFTLATQTVPLGTITTSTTGSGTSTFAAATNAQSGYAVTVSGTTLTSGSDTITALSTQTASTQGSSQFGINLVANTTPSVGSNVSHGSGNSHGAAATNYATTNQFRYVSGDTVASSTQASDTDTYTVSYIANISPVTHPGSYSTILQYVCSPTF